MTDRALAQERGMMRYREHAYPVGLVAHREKGVVTKLEILDQLRICDEEEAAMLRHIEHRRTLLRDAYDALVRREQTAPLDDPEPNTVYPHSHGSGADLSEMPEWIASIVDKNQKPLRHPHPSPSPSPSHGRNG